ncbi:MAG TPA: glycosyltransferase family 4 protein, partial [Thermoleophilia bacterium]
AGPTLLGVKCALHAVLLGDYDIVHVHGFENGFVLPILGLRYPTVMTFHGRGPVGKWGRIAWTLMHSMEPLSMKCASVTTSVSLHDARELSAQYRRLVAHVPNGVDCDLAVDTEAAARLLARHGVSGGRFWLFCAARVVPSKGCLQLLQAYRRVPSAPPLVVVGDLGHAPDHAAELRGAAEGLDVHFVPLVSDRPALLGLLQSASAFLFPSDSEGMSMMLLEAMAYGGPVVAGDIPANRDVVAGSGELAPPGEVDGWVQVLTALRDAAEADLVTRRAAGRQRALTEFNWDRVTWAYEELYERVLERPLRRR